jgi:hypothetical protein
LQRLGVMQIPRKLKLNKPTIFEPTTDELEVANDGIAIPTTTVRRTDIEQPVWRHSTNQEQRRKHGTSMLKNQDKIAVLVMLVVAGCTSADATMADDPGVEDVGALGQPASLSLSFGSIVALQASNGQFVSSQGGQSGSAMNVYANRNTMNAWEKFLVIPRGPGDMYALMCQGDNSHRAYYLSAEGGGGGDVHCNRTAIGPWETFQVAPRPGPSVTLRTSGGWYLNAQNGGGGGIDARQTLPLSSTMFRISAATPFTPGVDGCVGAVGDNCKDLLHRGTCAWKGNLLECNISIGAMLHDSCCSNHPLGVSCGPKQSTNDCQDEWTHAEGDTLRGRQWKGTFDPTRGGVARPYVMAYLKQSGGQLVGVPTPAALPVPTNQVIWCGDAPAFCPRGFTPSLASGDDCLCN